MPGGGLCGRGRLACILADAVATSYHAVVTRAQARPGMTVALVGVGGGGRPTLPIARLAGERTIAVDISDARLSSAGELGADELVDARRAPFSEQVRALTGGEGADVVMEFASNADTLPQSYRNIGKAGRRVFVGYTPGGPLGRNVLAV